MHHFHGILQKEYIVFTCSYLEILGLFKVLDNVIFSLSETLIIENYLSDLKYMLTKKLINTENFQKGVTVSFIQFKKSVATRIRHV